MFLLPLMVLALTSPTPPITGTTVRLTTIRTLITDIAQFLLVVALVIAVIFIVWGGIRWITAGGSEDAVKKAKATIINGIIGAAIVLAVGLILQTLAGIIARGLVL